MNENKNRGWRIAETILLICIIGLVFLLKLSTDAALFKKEYNKFSDRGLARINIVLDGISLKEIDEGSKETKYEGNKLVLYKDKQIKVFNNVEIKGRGNTTWLKEKKPYQIKLSHNVDLLNTGKSKKWVLLANSLDSTHLRNDIAMMLAEM
ncbi:CotH kinase family protein, partial [Candidatus Saccharibacteria bacterium]|nr:CotH kinase family protein [Candidatus Saccharibacteria bacterium]